MIINFLLTGLINWKLLVNSYFIFLLDKEDWWLKKLHAVLNTAGIDVLDLVMAELFLLGAFSDPQMYLCSSFSAIGPVVTLRLHVCQAQFSRNVSSFCEQNALPQSLIQNIQVFYLELWKDFHQIIYKNNSTVLSLPLSALISAKKTGFLIH